ncbi:MULTISPECIES: MurR/RpiR family transcriptional regulator [Priestia]|jgi:DNA-binding MurR/RpiR family transcriptional regulator|uniref:MurR/RpiR family transcriptional regulator n=1 Tax=Priestia TaxID=2800373 RepID=UPI001F470515|nr:MurR/RpiR family transcriptional regulator [Priestia megaterium]MCF8888128.1 MurR/RpiR family transcriptional regulator [Priestia megaterium]
MNPSFQELIKHKFPDLSRGQKKVAEFLVNFTEKGSLYTAGQIGKEAGVSETTVIRLAYALGLNGFSDLQELMRKEWLSSAESKEAASKPAAEEKKPFSEWLSPIDEKELSQAVDALIKSDQVYIAGFRESHTAAYWLYYKMNQLRNHVLLSFPTGFLLETLCNLTSESAVVVFSLPRYTKEALEVAQQAKKQGAKVIAITDRRLSPVGQIADITLLAGTTEHILSLLALSQIVISSMQKRDEKTAGKRQEHLEKLYAEQGIFLE